MLSTALFADRADRRREPCAGFLYPWFRPIAVTFIAGCLIWWFWAKAREKVVNAGPSQMAELRPTLDIVAPFFNEAPSASAFAELLAELEAAVAQRFGMTVHKILVDDGSRDDGAERFSQALSGSWEIVRLSRNFGKEVAVLAGLDRSRGDMVLIMDADLQHSMDISLKLIAELVEHPDIDVVYAQNDRREASWRRSQLARLFYSLINSSQRFDIPENAGDFRVMRGAVARALTSLRDKRRFNKGLFAWAGFRQKALPYSPEDRASGTSKWSRLNLIAFSLEGFTSFSVIPLRLISLSGLLAALAARSTAPRCSSR